MAVTETLRALGSWGITFKSGMPDALWKEIDYFGHIAIHVGKRPTSLDDSLLRSARYVGPIDTISDHDQRSIGGTGMATWLGDADGKGDVFSEPLVLNSDFATAITAALPPSGAVIAGTITNTGDNFTGTFQFQNAREIIDYICQTVNTPAGWRVNGDGTLDAGPESALFVTDPRCLVVHKSVGKAIAGFDDMWLRALAGNSEIDRDVKDYTTGVLLLAQGINGQFVAAEAETDEAEIPFKDLHGNVVRRTRIVQESETNSENAPARAQLQLNRFKSTRDALALSTSNFDIKGTAQVGDYLWAYDPRTGLMDNANEVVFRGQRINPYKLRLTETTWPITKRMSVFYRNLDGEWFDLSRYVQAEQGDTQLVVGGYNRSLSEGGSGSFPVSPPPDTSVPGVVTWNEPFLLSVYQSPVTGVSRGEAILSWDEPLNEDGSNILDGSHYEIRYRRATIPDYPVTIDMIKNMGLTHDQIKATGATFGHMIFFGETEWQSAVAPFDTTTFRLQELVPAMPYETQIRAVDLANPSNRGAWSDLALFTTTKDNIPPATPAPPFIASNPLFVQMTHTLGAASGGEYNLDRDLHHLELHGGPEPLFSVTDDTLLGKALANYGSLIGQIPVVQTFSQANTDYVYYKVVAVDEAGNKSLPSQAVPQQVGLLDSQYISFLTASKITAGTLNASVIVGGRLATMTTGSFPGVEMDATGIKGWTTSGFNALKWDAFTGRLHVNGDGGIEIQDGALLVRNAAGDVIVELGECSDGRHGLQVYKDDGTRVLRAGELASSGGDGIEVLSDTGALVRISALAFGMNAATITGVAATSLTSYNGNTPSVSVEIGNTGRALVHYSCWILPGSDSTGFPTGGEVSFFANGPGGATVAAASAQGLAAAGDNFGLGRSYLVTGLTPGTWSFFLTYRASIGTVTNTQFYNRHIAVQPF